VRIFYGTDRAATGNPDPNDYYANDRDTTRDNPLVFGFCDVSIPLSDRHRIGGLESPSVWKLEFSEAAAKHVILRRVLPCDGEEFFASLSDRVSRSERREAFVFVHGYNVSFRDAARRTAQLAYDLSFDGAPILFSWPSRARWWLYPADETLVEWSVPHLESFLALVALSSGARTIHLIAHSMGNRCLAKALELLVAKGAVSPSSFRHIVLTAPDIDAQTFLELARVIVPAGERLTFYANYRDRALLLSKLFHLYRRAGSSIVIVRGMDTIDASRVDTSLTRHSYFGSSRTVLADLSALLIDGRPPSKRFGMREKRNAQGIYYNFRP
jgi:esterase/lipase superfamily enzyme